MAKDKSGNFGFVRLNVLDVAIMGGKDLPEQERGPLDTATDKGHPLYDERLKKVKITPEWVDNIGHNGVKETVEVVYLTATGEAIEKGSKEPSIPFIVNGRQRIRGARLAAKKLGQDMFVYAKVENLDVAGMISDMITLNVHHEDSTSTKIAKAQRALKAGIDIDAVARAFSVKKQTIDMWLAYDKNAIKEVKAAVDSGKIAAAIGFDIARSGNAEVQLDALNRVMALGTKETENGERTGKAGAAKRAVAEAQGKRAAVLDKKTLKKFLALVADTTLPKNAGAELHGWYGGVQDCLEFILGTPEKELSDDAKRLVKLMKQLDGVEEKEDSEEDSTPSETPKKDKKGKKGKKSNPTEETPPASDDGDDE